MIDSYIEDRFTGNVVEELISRGYKFEIISETEAVLHLPVSVNFVKSVKI